MNTALLRRIQKKILAEPTQFQMDQWYMTDLPITKPIANCGTAACIGGWAYALTQKVKPNIARKKAISIRDMADTAMHVLALNFFQAERLFYFNYWPKRFKKIGPKRQGTAAFARQAVRRIDHFIKTNGQE